MKSISAGWLWVLITIIVFAVTAIILRFFYRKKTESVPDPKVGALMLSNTAIAMILNEKKTGTATDKDFTSEEFSNEFA